MLRLLQIEDIKTLASRKEVRRIAVENFLMTVHHNESKQQALMNLKWDAERYRWNTATIRAIEDGIDQADS